MRLPRPGNFANQVTTSRLIGRSNGRTISGTLGCRRDSTNAIPVRPRRLAGRGSDVGLGQRGSRDAHPNFEGIWNSATATPLERPAELKNKPFFTPEEAAQWEQQFIQRNADPPAGAAKPTGGTGTYNAFFREFGTRVVKTLRTSIITEPADGRIPGLTPAAADVKRRRLEGLKKFENPEDLGLQDQCLSFLTSGPPMLPYSYNSNYQIVQTADAVLIHAEMIHDARIIHMDGRPHLSPRIRLSSGDSIGRWRAPPS